MFVSLENRNMPIRQKILDLAAHRQANTNYLAQSPKLLNQLCDFDILLN